MTFLEIGILGSNWFRNTYFFSENTSSKMWPFVTLGWPDPFCSWLAWSQIAKWLWFFEFYVNRDYKSCTICPKKEFLILVTFPDLLWPDLEPDLYLVQCEIFKDFTWKIACNGIHSIFITDNFFIIDYKRSHTYKVYIPIPGDHFCPSDHFLVIFDKNVCWIVDAYLSVY